MCGRYSLLHTEKLADRYKAAPPTDTLPESRNIAPTGREPVIINHGQNEIRLMRWGLIPAWSKNLTSGNHPFNARAETLAERPTFRSLISRNRCLIPASGFYEWLKKENGSKQPYLFTVKYEEIFSFAGLYDRWVDAEGKEIYSYTIITVPANEIVRPIHDRMPAIIGPAREEEWANVQEESWEEARRVLDESQQIKLTAVPASPV